MEEIGQLSQETSPLEQENMIKLDGNDIEIVEEELFLNHLKALP